MYWATPPVQKWFQFYIDTFPWAFYLCISLSISIPHLFFEKIYDFTIIVPYHFLKCLIASIANSRLEVVYLFWAMLESVSMSLKENLDNYLCPFQICFICWLVLSKGPHRWPGLLLSYGIPGISFTDCCWRHSYFPITTPGSTTPLLNAKLYNNFLKSEFIFLWILKNFSPNKKWLEFWKLIWNLRCHVNLPT